MDDSSAERFVAIYRDYYGMVRCYACRRFGAENADDIAQETMLRALQRLDELDLDRPIGPWLLRVARNAGIDAQRRRGATAVPDDLLHALAPAVPDESAAVHTTVDVRGVLGGAMRRLSESDRHLLAMHDVHGVAMADLAAGLGATPTSMRKRLSRARLRFGLHYRELGGQPYGA